MPIFLVELLKLSMPVVVQSSTVNLKGKIKRAAENLVNLGQIPDRFVNNAFLGEADLFVECKAMRDSREGPVEILVFSLFPNGREGWGEGASLRCTQSLGEALVEVILQSENGSTNMPLLLEDELWHPSELFSPLLQEQTGYAT